MSYELNTFLNKFADEVLENFENNTTNFKPKGEEKMNELRVFAYTTGDYVRAANVDGKPMFIAKDVCALLGYVRDTSLVVGTHCKHSKLLRPSEIDGLEINPRGMTVIPESDVFRLIMRSNMPDAEQFQDWVCETVLPALRVTGNLKM